MACAPAGVAHSMLFPNGLTSLMPVGVGVRGLKKGPRAGLRPEHQKPAQAVDGQRLAVI